MTALEDHRTSRRVYDDDYADVDGMLTELAELADGTADAIRQREAVVARCLPLAENIARRFRNRGEAHEDLVQVARVGLVNAVNRYDPANGASFVGYAVPTMMGEVRRYFRDHAWSVKVPRRLKDLNSSINAAKGELGQRLQRAPTASEIAEHLDVDREEVVEGLLAANAYSTESTDKPILRDDDSYSVADSIGELDAGIEKVIDVESVRPLIQALPETQRAVLQMRFFDNMTQTQIADRIGHSQMHVSRLLNRALTTLRDQLG